jgi:protein-disulfide isomerase
VKPEIIKQFVDTGKARFVAREFPLNSIHPAAQIAAEAAVCAGKQNEYWKMSETLFEKQAEWSALGAEAAATLKGYAKELGLDTNAFNTCLDSGEAKLDVQSDLMAGQQVGVQGTPSLFINDMEIQASTPITVLETVIAYAAAGGKAPEIFPSGDNYHMAGNTQTAKAAMVAFVDYASPDSAKHALEVLPKLKETYIDTGKLAYMVHPWSPGTDTPSFKGAMAAECAGQQNKFWEMHTQLFADQAKWTQAADPNPLFAEYAGTLGLDKAKFEECLGSQWATMQAQTGNVVAALYGIPGAPTFLFNNRTGKEGSPTFEEFKTVIDSILNQ